MPNRDGRGPWWAQVDLAKDGPGPRQLVRPCHRNGMGRAAQHARRNPARAGRGARFGGTSLAATTGSQS